MASLLWDLESLRAVSRMEATQRKAFTALEIDWRTEALKILGYQGVRAAVDYGAPEKVADRGKIIGKRESVRETVESWDAMGAGMRGTCERARARKECWGAARPVGRD